MARLQLEVESRVSAAPEPELSCEIVGCSKKRRPQGRSSFGVASAHVEIDEAKPRHGAECMEECARAKPHKNLANDK